MNSDPTSETAAREFVITRTFDAPRELVWKAWTEREHLMRWFGPKGVTIAQCALDLRPGGVFHYGMKTPDGHEMWGKWTFREIAPPERLVVIASFSDANQGVTRHPLSATWPLETRSETTLAEQDGRTTIEIRWSVFNGTPEEQATFDAAHQGMKQGWTGTLDQLEEYLANETPAADREIVSTRVIAFPRERVFGAFRDPKMLALWWGPKDFKNTFHEFDFRAGGHWRFVMHGPDGTDYKNENVFAEIAEPGRIAIDHVSWPNFRLTTTLADQDGKTAITWRMRFQLAEDCAKVRPICVEANQQNFDRLESVLQMDPSAVPK